MHTGKQVGSLQHFTKTCNCLRKCILSSELQAALRSPLPPPLQHPLDKQPLLIRMHVHDCPGGQEQIREGSWTEWLRSCWQSWMGCRAPQKAPPRALVAPAMTSSSSAPRTGMPAPPPFLSRHGPVIVTFQLGYGHLLSVQSWCDEAADYLLG